MRVTTPLRSRAIVNVLDEADVVVTDQLVAVPSAAETNASGPAIGIDFSIAL